MHWPESTTRRPVRTHSPRIDSIEQKPAALMRGSSGEVAMKTLLIAESAVLALAGLPLAVFPSTTIFLLLGAQLDDQVADVERLTEKEADNQLAVRNTEDQMKETMR